MRTLRYAWTGLLSMLVPVAAGAQPEILTLSAPTAFSAEGFSGSVDPISPDEMMAIDFTGSGALFDASDGSHICEFAGFQNPACDYSGLIADTTDEFVAYKVNLDGGSAPLQSIGLYVEIPTGSGIAAPKWAGYVFDSDPTTVTASSSFVFSLFSILPHTAQGRGHSFADLSDASNSALWLQPGEMTATHLVAFPAGLVDDVAAGASFGILFGDFGDQTPNVQPVTLVPEPPKQLGSIAAVLVVLLAHPRIRAALVHGPLRG